MGPIGCPETSVRNYYSTPRKIPEQGGHHLHYGGNRRFCVVLMCFVCVSYALPESGKTKTNSLKEGLEAMKRSALIWPSSRLYVHSLWVQKESYTHTDNDPVDETAPPASLCL